MLFRSLHVGHALAEQVISRFEVSPCVVGQLEPAGTTTATLLAQVIIRKGFKNVAAGANPMELKRGIEGAVQKSVEEVEKQSHKVATKESISQVASVSAGDTQIGSLIAEAMEKVGRDGVITVEESKSLGTVLDVVEGMQFDRGYLSAYMVSDTDKMEAIIEKVADRKSVV